MCSSLRFIWLSSSSELHATSVTSSWQTAVALFSVHLIIECKHLCKRVTLKLCLPAKPCSALPFDCHPLLYLSSMHFERSYLKKVFRTPWSPLTLLLLPFTQLTATQKSSLSSPRDSVISLELQGGHWASLRLSSSGFSQLRQNPFLFFSIYTFSFFSDPRSGESKWFTAGGKCAPAHLQNLPDTKLTVLYSQFFTLISFL